MKHWRHNTTIPSAMFLMACASLIFFLPAAISMNAPAPTDISDGFSSKRNLYGPSEQLAIPATVGGDPITNENAPITRNGAYEGILPSSEKLVDTPAAENKKSSLPLKAAAIIGSSSAVAAAFLAAGGGK
jgi:hypothetical protein